MATIGTGAEDIFSLLSYFDYFFLGDLLTPATDSQALN